MPQFSLAEPVCGVHTPLLRPLSIDLSLQPAAAAARPRAVERSGLPMSTRQPAGAQDEWGRTLESWRADLTRFALWLARDRAVAEDIVQETMLRAWRSRTGLREYAAVRAWLFTIVRREHARLYERKQLPLVDIDLSVARADPGLVWYDEDPQLHELRQALLRLPDEYRVPLAMQVLGGFTAAEIATELDLTVNAVLTRLYRARNQLRELYGNPSHD